METLSDNAAIVYQTHKVSAAKMAAGLCSSGFRCVTMTDCVPAGVAGLSEGRALPVRDEEDLGQQRERPRHLAGVQLLCGPRRCAGEHARLGFLKI